MHSGCHPAKILPAGVGFMLKFLLGSLGKGVFERRTSTGSEILFILKWLDSTKFVFNFESLSYYRDDLSKILGKNTAQEFSRKF